MSAIKTDKLRRWGDTTPSLRLDAAQAADASNTDTLKAASKFPLDKDVNNKVVLCFEDVWLMEVDAIVNTTNEALTERTGCSGSIMFAGGPELATACVHSDPCRTGEAVITVAGRLAAKHVIHTVGPKYNEKYKTAAENALHNCYRNCLRVLKENDLSTIAFPCVYTTKKGYPREAAAHIAIRSVRRFLENFGDSVDLVVLCVDNASDLQQYQKLMPLYMPRDKDEETAAKLLLPNDTGNELGETVIEDRKIRIGSLPGVAAAPVMIPSKSKGSAAGGGGAGGGAGAGEGVPAALRALSPIDTTLAARASAAAAAGGAGGGAGTSSKPGLQVSNADVANDFDFASMRLDPDEARLMALTAAATPEDIAAEEYDELLTRAGDEDLSDITALDLVYSTGPDNAGRPVIVVLASRIPAPKVDAERVVMYLIKVMEDFVEGPFSVLYVHSALSKANAPSSQFLARVYRLLPRQYKKNCKALYVLHPNFYIKKTFLMLRPMLSKKFQKKLVYIDRVRDLARFFVPELVSLPETVYKRDLDKHRRNAGAKAKGKTKGKS